MNAFVVKTIKYGQLDKFILNKLDKELHGTDWNLFILFNLTESNSEDLAGIVSDFGNKVIPYTEDDFRRYNFTLISEDDVKNTAAYRDYKGNTMLIYNMAYQELFFYLKNKNYAKYFFIENDCIFNGDTRVLLNRLDAAEAYDFVPVTYSHSIDVLNLLRFNRQTTFFISDTEYYKSLLQCALFSPIALQRLVDIYLKKNMLMNEIGFPTYLRKFNVKRDEISFASLGLIDWNFFNCYVAKIKDSILNHKIPKKDVFIHPVKNYGVYSQILDLH